MSGVYRFVDASAVAETLGGYQQTRVVLDEHRVELLFLRECLEHLQRDVLVIIDKRGQVDQGIAQPLIFAGAVEQAAPADRLRRYIATSVLFLEERHDDTATGMSLNRRLVLAGATAGSRGRR